MAIQNDIVVSSDGPANDSAAKQPCKDRTQGKEQGTSRPKNQWGRRLIPRVADELAAANPERPYAYVARSANIDDGFYELTIKDLVNVVNSLSWWIKEEYGHSTKFDTIAFMGVSDVTYAMLWLAIVKTGHKFLTPSARNSTEMNLSLLEDTSCDIFFYSASMQGRVDELTEGRPTLKTAIIPALDELLKRQGKHYPYEKTFEEAINDPVYVPHTSGSTGRPKPITITHGALAVNDGARNVPEIPGRINQTYALWDFKGTEAGLFFSAFPPFHASGMTNMAFLPIFYPAAVVLGPPDRPSTGEIVSQIMRKLELRAVMAPPSILEQIAKDEEGVEMLAKLDWVMFTGGPLAPSVGDKISKLTTLCQVYGQTETFVICALVPRPEDWAWFEFHPAYGQDMELVGEGQYEMVINMDRSKSGMRAINHMFPNVEQWRMKDVFIRHPLKENLWRFQGRTDDIMVLGNGEKLNPVPMESIIQGHRKLSGALMVGQGHDQPVLIVETLQEIPDEAGKAALVEEIMPQIRRANEAGPSHAKILQSHVIVTDSTKPFQRTGKGTVVRKTSTADFTDEIDSIYNNDEVLKRNDLPELTEPGNSEAVENFIRESLTIVFPKDIPDSQQDFFANGMDSLQAMELSAILRSGTQSHFKDENSSWPKVQVIYANSTLERLTQAIYRKLNGDKGPVGESEDKNDRTAAMQEMVKKYTRDLPVAKGGTLASESSDELVVLLTGSTGSFGTALLEALFDVDGPVKIICLNRSQDAKERHMDSFERRNLSQRYDLEDSSKVEFLQVDFADPRLGLSEENYGALLRTATVLIHNAWKVDFNHALSSFEPHLTGVRHLIDFSAASAHHAHLFFVSSIASAMNPRTGSADTKVPEEPMHDFQVAGKTGYGESKHVAERILQAAVESKSVKASILRVGQIGGRVLVEDPREAGRWNDTEWFPSLVRSSITLGKIPDRIPKIDWVPIDLLAEATLEIMHADLESSNSGIYHLVNPQAGEWDDLREAIVQYYSDENDPKGGMKTVNMSDWVKSLREVGDGGTDMLVQLPAMKLLDYFEELEKDNGDEQVTFETKRAEHASDTLKDLQPVGRSWMSMWLEQWDY